MNKVKYWIASILSVSLAVTGIVTPMSADDTGKVVSFRKTELDVDPRQYVTVAEKEEEEISDDQIVRVSIVLDGESTLDAGYEPDTAAIAPAAIAYRK